MKNELFKPEVANHRANSAVRAPHEREGNRASPSRVGLRASARIGYVEGGKLNAKCFNRRR